MQNIKTLINLIMIVTFSILRVKKEEKIEIFPTNSRDSSEISHVNSSDEPQLICYITRNEEKHNYNNTEVSCFLFL